MSTTSATHRVKAEIAARVKAKNNARDTMEEAKVSFTLAEPWFLDEDAEDTSHKVALSSLVPNWKRGHEDVMVTVFMQSDYPEHVRVHIPEVNKNYRPNLKALSELAYALEKTDTNILLTGLPSVGKSSLVAYYCAITNRPLYRFNYNGTMDSSSILGTISASAGSTTWHDGFLTEGIQVENAVLLHDEPMSAPPEVMLCLQNLFEKGGYLILPDKPGSAEDKKIIPAMNVRHVLADNTRGNGDTTGKFVGTQPQNTATLDRIGSFIQVDFLEPKDEESMLKATYPSATPKLLAAMVRVANLCRTAYVNGDLTVVMSARVLFSWVQHSLNLKDYDKGLEIAYLNRFDNPSEVEAVKGMMVSVFGK